MPLKSRRQMKKLFALENQGKIKPGTAEEFVRSTPNIASLHDSVGATKSYRKSSDTIRGKSYKK